MLASTHDMLKKACKEQYAVPAINTQGGTYDIIRAICMAADELHSPIILAHYHGTGAYSGHKWFYENGKHMAQKVNVPVAIHYDHGETLDDCMEMIHYGFTSIMYDGSALSIEENANKSNQLGRVCKHFGIALETEIGGLVRLDSQGKITGSMNVADPEDVKRYLRLCAPDSLALGIGNAHGFYGGTPDIRLDILEQCRSFTDIPFVLHGCTGMHEDVIKKSLIYGIGKINFGTQIRVNYIKYLKEGLDNGIDRGHAWRLSQYVEARLREDIKAIIRLAGSEGKA